MAAAASRVREGASAAPQALGTAPIRGRGTMPFLMSAWMCGRPLTAMRLLYQLHYPPLLPPSRFRPRLPPRVGSGCTEAVGAHYSTPPVL